MANNGDNLTSEQCQQIRDECQKLVDGGMLAAKAKEYLAKRWKKSESRVRGLCTGILTHTAPQEPLDANIPLDTDRVSQSGQIRAECEALVAKGMAPADAKRLLQDRWKKSESRIRNICRGIAASQMPNEPLDAQAVAAAGLGKISISLNQLADDDPRITELIEAERVVRKLREESVSAKRRILTLENQLQNQAQRLELFEHLSSESTSMTITPSKATKDKGEAVAIIQASDWHVGEFVYPEKVNYWNKYNPDIAEQSARLFFERSVKLLEKERQHINIKKVLLHLGGDMMTGHIHEELKETTAYSPNEEAQFAKHLIIGGIEYWLNHIEELSIVCNYGNHGRTNPEKKIASGAENSFEWAMYHDIARYFEKEPRIKFLIPRGEWAYVDVDKYTLRFTHLDAVRYVGGVGGISIPLIKAIHNWNSAKKSDMTFGGHFHQTLINDQIGFSVNNCLIGINPYGMRFGRPTPATQNFRLLDLKRGFTVFAPIVCDDGDRLDKKTSYPGMDTRWHAKNLSQKEMTIK